MARIVCIGEGMLELSGRGDDWTLGFGGDTLNTAIHLARAGHDVAYLTALGTDDFSADLRRRWSDEGIDCSLVLSHPDRRPGLYAISIDDRGERSFTYWRDSSAARAMFDLPEMDGVLETAAGADLLSFSLVTLAILPAEARARLLDLAHGVRAGGGKVAFDGNYRPLLWSSREGARAGRDAAIAVADIGLPTLEDEAALSGEETAEDVACHWQGFGCAETVVKLGAAGCRLPDGTRLAPEVRLDPVDTSGAGDAFNGGYLAARLAGASPAEAAVAGHRVAGWTIMRPGAIPPRDAAAPYA